MTDPCPLQLVEDYDRAVREVHMAFSDIAEHAAVTRRNILANLIITDNRIDIAVRTRTANAQATALNNDRPLRQLRAAA